MASKKGRGERQQNVGKVPLQVIQITDTHLYADQCGCLLGLNTQHSFELILEQVRRQHWPADAVLATGDLTHDGSPAAYIRLHRQLATLGIPVYCLPGNHDEPAQVGRLLKGGKVQTTSCAEHGAWGFVFLDSTRPSSEGGHVSNNALMCLRKCLQQFRQRHLLVCLHHQPVPVGSRWLDTMTVDNATELFKVLDAAPQVRAILWGHVHQIYEGERNGVHLLSCPSTCVQFLPGAENFALDPSPPGYRWLRLYPDGRIDTGVERLPTWPPGLDLEGKDY
jgi:Icc protein